MTRFARAKGSKASNERIPNEATPWCVMKQQLNDDSSTKNDRQGKTKTARELLQEKDDPFYYDTTGNVNTDWAEIKSADTSTSASNTKKTLNIRTAQEKKRKLRGEETNDSKDVSQNFDHTSKKQEKKLKKQKCGVQNQDPSPSEIDEATLVKKKNRANDKAEKKKKNESLIAEKKEDSTSPELSVTNSEPKKKNSKNNVSPTEINASESSDSKNLDKKSSLVVSKRHKRNQKRLEKKALITAAATNEKTSNPGAFDAAGNDWSSDVNFGKRRKCEKTEGSERDGTDENSTDPKKPQTRRNVGQPEQPRRQAPKIRDNKEHKRRKPDASSIKCMINGMELEIVKYDRFPVKKEDAERMKELKQQMIMKGIPKSEIDAAMKLERRRAEKALARVRKQVCFHCRKAGHNLSDCPDLGKEETATGICFKCGSTEHTHFECRVTKKEEYRFASCFICREQGHIAKQCPDNPKGLYPQGGSCKICGDVTHLRKDCPELTQEKEENIVTLSTIGESTLESLDEDKARKFSSDDDKTTKRKIVKF